MPMTLALLALLVAPAVAAAADGGDVVSLTAVTGPRAGFRYRVELSSGTKAPCLVSVGPADKAPAWHDGKRDWCGRVRRLVKGAEPELGRSGVPMSADDVAGAPLPDAPEVGILAARGHELGVDLAPVATCGPTLKNCEKPRRTPVAELTAALLSARR
jgi:hypothetical protein